MKIDKHRIEIADEIPDRGERAGAVGPQPDDIGRVRLHRLLVVADNGGGENVAVEMFEQMLAVGGQAATRIVGRDPGEADPAVHYRPIIQKIDKVAYLPGDIGPALPRAVVS